MNFIIILIFLFTVIIWFISRKVYNTVVNPCNCMNIIWLFCTFFSQFGIYDFRIPNSKTYLYVLMMLISFSLFSLLGFMIFTRNMMNCNKIIKFNYNLSINTKIIWGLFLIFVLFLIPFLRRTIPHVLIGEWKYVRNTFLEGANRSNFVSYLQMYIYNYIIRPFFIAVSVIAAYATATRNSRKNSLLMIGAIGAILHALVTGGRKEIFNFIVFLVIALIIDRTNQSLKFVTKYKWKRKKLKDRLPYFLFVVMLLGIGFITSQRLHFGQTIFQTFFQYSIGPMSYLDIVVNNYSKFGIENGNYLFGKATLGFITGPIDTIVAVLTGGDFAGAEHLLNVYAEEYYLVSPKVKLNATATIIYAFLRDFGTIGVVLGGGIFAFVINVILYFSLTTDSGRWKCILIICYFTLIFSVWRYALVCVDFYMAVLWVIVLFSGIFSKQVILKVR